jgi:hypothetical protein
MRATLSERENVQGDADRGVVGGGALAGGGRRKCVSEETGRGGNDEEHDEEEEAHELGWREAELEELRNYKEFIRRFLGEHLEIVKRKN